MDNQKIDVLKHLARARALRQKSAEYVISDEELTKAKREGRMEWHQLSEPSLTRLWDNEQDAVYDNWRELYKED